MKNKRADSLFIRKLRVPALIGVCPQERGNLQTLLIDVDMTVEIAAAVATDDLSKTINYADVVKFILATVSDSSYRLIESLAAHVVTRLQQQFSLTTIRLSITKRPFDLPEIEEGVGVVIERH